MGLFTDIRFQTAVLRYQTGFQGCHVRQFDSALVSRPIVIDFRAIPARAWLLRHFLVRALHYTILHPAFLHSVQKMDLTITTDVIVGAFAGHRLCSNLLACSPVLANRIFPIVGAKRSFVTIFSIETLETIAPKVRIVCRHEAIAGVGAAVDGAGIGTRRVLGHLIRDIEPVHVQQIVENAYVIALEAVELELDHQKLSERPQVFVLEHVPLGDLLY